jgi:hypothetical protein
MTYSLSHAAMVVDMEELYHAEEEQGMLGVSCLPSCLWHHFAVGSPPIKRTKISADADCNKAMPRVHTERPCPQGYRI